VERVVGRGLNGSIWIWLRETRSADLRCPDRVVMSTGILGLVNDAQRRKKAAKRGGDTKGRARTWDKGRQSRVEANSIHGGSGVVVC